MKPRKLSVAGNLGATLPTGSADIYIFYEWFLGTLENHIYTRSTKKTKDNIYRKNPGRYTLLEELENPGQDITRSGYLSPYKRTLFLSPVET